MKKKVVKHLPCAINNHNLFISNIDQSIISFHYAKAFERQCSTEDYHRIYHVKQVGFTSVKEAIMTGKLFTFLSYIGVVN